MTVNETILKRQSIRKYIKDFEIPKDDIKKMLEAGMHAPSACNTRPWEFYVLKSMESKEKARQIHPHARHLDTASIAILVCAKPERQGPVAEGFFPQDCGAVTQNIMLSAYELGYGSCWCGIFPRENLITSFKETFDILSIPFALITIGKPDESPSKKGYYDESIITIL